MRRPRRILAANAPQEEAGSSQREEQMIVRNLQVALLCANP
jgi:hypothetical protein